MFLDVRWKDERLSVQVERLLLQPEWASVPTPPFKPKLHYANSPPSSMFSQLLQGAQSGNRSFRACFGFLSL